MLIQALPLFGANCSASIGSQYALTYSIAGPHMTTSVSGTISSLIVVGTVDAGSCVSASLAGSGPYSVFVAPVGAAKDMTPTVVQNGNAVVTYGRVGAVIGGGAVTVVRNRS